jgi:wyosine [tRNA(Phe)-imidazoG37] synthetase (radical SAM superfamily)
MTGQDIFMLNRPHKGKSYERVVKTVEEFKSTHHHLSGDAGFKNKYKYV